MSKENRAHLSRKDYMGGKSTLCVGCGHDSITNHIISAFFQSDIPPHKVIKTSGIGCSSKTPAYFLNRAHGFNSLHGRMAPVSTGAKVANHQLNSIGVSGDGDSASIGLGGFSHLIRRDLPMLYIVANNGVYGLTKGQFSATADKNSTLKSGELNSFAGIDLCHLAIQLGCRFVARSFSGDAKQLVPLISAAIHHQGTAFIDVLSPCITYANHEGSTKSYHYIKDHLLPLQELGFIQSLDEIEVDYQPGTSKEVELHDGSRILLKKINDQDYDPANSMNAMSMLHKSQSEGSFLTGLIYHNTENDNSFFNQLNLTEKPLSELGDNDLIPNSRHLDEILDQFS